MNADLIKLRGEVAALEKERDELRKKKNDRGEMEKLEAQAAFLQAECAELRKELEVA